MTGDQKGDQLIPDVLGRQTLARNVVSSIEKSVEEVVTSFPAIFAGFDELARPSAGGTTRGHCIQTHIIGEIVQKLDILLVLFVCLDVHPSSPWDPPEPIRARAQTARHGADEGMVLLRVERVEAV